MIHLAYIFEQNNMLLKKSYYEIVDLKEVMKGSVKLIVIFITKRSGICVVNG